jgi:hypothetical protein
MADGGCSYFRPNSAGKGFSEDFMLEYIYVYRFPQRSPDELMRAQSRGTALISIAVWVRRPWMYSGVWGWQRLAGYRRLSGGVVVWSI